MNRDGLLSATNTNWQRKRAAGARRGKETIEIEGCLYPWLLIPEIQRADHRALLASSRSRSESLKRTAPKRQSKGPILACSNMELRCFQGSALMASDPRPPGRPPSTPIPSRKQHMAWRLRPSRALFVLFCQCQCRYFFPPARLPLSLVLSTRVPSACVCVCVYVLETAVSLLL